MTKWGARFCCLFLVTGATTAAAQSVTTTYIYSDRCRCNLVGENSPTGPLERSASIENSNDVSAGATSADYGSLASSTSVVTNAYALPNTDITGNMQAVAVWQDYVTITGTTPGQSVDFHVNVSVDGELDVPDLRANAIDPNTASIIGSTVGHWLWGFPGAGACFAGGFGAPYLTPCNASGSWIISRGFGLGQQTGYQEQK